MSNDLYNWNLQEGAPFGEDSPLEDLADEVGSWLISENVHFKPAPAQSQGEDAKLEPCPFCGGQAKRIDVPSVEDGPNAGGSFIECQHCHASSKIVFGEKVGLKESWNTRALLASAQSSAQGEGAREIVAARDEEWKAWIKAKGFNLEPLAGCL